LSPPVDTTDASTDESLSPPVDATDASTDESLSPPVATTDASTAESLSPPVGTTDASTAELLSPPVATTDASTDESLSTAESLVYNDREIRLSLLSISGDKDRSGVIVVNGIDYQYTSEALSNQYGRGAKTFVFQSSFTNSIPSLYGYKLCAGYMTRLYAFVSLCMMQSGDMLVCVLETRCNKPRYDPVIFDAQSQTCSISRDNDWRCKTKLDIGAKLTFDIDVVKK